MERHSFHGVFVLSEIFNMASKMIQVQIKGQNIGLFRVRESISSLVSELEEFPSDSEWEEFLSESQQKFVFNMLCAILSKRNRY